METQEQTFGLESVERSAGYIPAVVDMPSSEPQGEEITRTELENVAAEISAQRDEQTRAHESRPVDQTIAVTDRDGTPRPDNESLTPEEGAHLVASARNQQDGEKDWAERNALQAQIDALRSGNPTVEQLQQPDGPIALDQTVQPQPEQPAAVDDDWQRHLQDPRLLNAVQQHVEQATAQANQAAQAYNNNAIYAANSALVGLGVTYPELANVTAQQLPVALQVIAKQNPQRAQDIVNHIGLINDTVKRGVEAQRQQNWQQFAQYQRQFNAWGATQDAEYEAYARQAVSPDEKQVIEAEARRMVLEGSDMQSVAMSWHTSRELRSAQAQRLLFDAARWRLAERARESARRKMSQPVPHVQRPGSPVERHSDQSEFMRRLEKPGQPLSAKEGAAIVTARRNAARRY